ncbi:5'-methylthioadenosine/S-adenosylhomocysteine nucleosidase [Anaerolineales bacterium HSG24]|nr:5'-methylthioadenosine/S-adenosylhomocysteine nucleosidase [Anaerolineales bacterium HSG24]
MNQIIVTISANIEWQVIRQLFPNADYQTSPLGEWFVISLSGLSEPILFFHSGWGKIAAAASTQYMIDRWSPELIINLGTCGGFLGEIERGEIILAEKTIVYDIIEQMYDQAEHIAHYSTELDLSWLTEPYPQTVRRTLLVSADRDIMAEQIPALKADYGAVAGDWESGAIAWTAHRNGTPCLILRGVSDLVGPDGGEAYQDGQVFVSGTERVMRTLVDGVTGWIERWDTTMGI